jgi:desulfoferrodoxin (superoxide reductase-like protein)
VEYEKRTALKAKMEEKHYIEWIEGNFSKSPGTLEDMAISLRARRTAELRPPMP